MRIAPGETLLEAGDKITERTGRQNDMVLTKMVDFSNKMRAELQGGGTVLSIEPITPPDQTVNTGEPGLWRWKVKGLEAGTVQLQVTLLKLMPGNALKTVSTPIYEVEVLVPDLPFPKNVIEWVNGLTDLVKAIGALTSALLVFAGILGFKRARSRTSDKTGEPD